MDIMSLPSVGPFVGVSWDREVTFDDLPGRHFRLLVYGAYNAFGLIGSECNGVAVLDVDNLKVVCDEIAKVGSGYCGPDPIQIAKFKELAEMSWAEFRILINTHPRSRMGYNEAGEISEHHPAGGR